MKIFNTKLFLLCLLALPALPLNAQQQLSKEQIADFNQLDIVRSLPLAVEWLDHSRALIRMPSEDSDFPTLMLADAKKKSYGECSANELPDIPFAVVDTKKGDNVTLSPDGKYMAYTRNNDLYTYNISNGKETRWTHDGSDVILNGYASWAYMEEILGRSTNYRAFWWSPDSKYLAFFRSDDSKTPLFTITQAAEQHGSIESLRYPKAGDEVTKVQLQVALVETNEWMVEMDTPLDGRYSNPYYLGTPIWRPDSKGLLIQWMNHGQDHLVLEEMNPESGMLKQLYSEKQKTWISLDTQNRVRYLKSGKGFILQSDRTGWNHLYLHAMDGKEMNPITSGEYTVLDVLLVDEKKSTVYFTCYKDNVACVDLYKVGFDGKKLQRLTFGEYSHNVSLSPNGSYFITRYSNPTSPEKMALYTTNGKLVMELNNSKGNNFDSYVLPKSELVTVKTKDGKFDLPMRIIYPYNMKEGETYPLIMATYGGPNAPRVRGSWTLTPGQIWYAKEGVIQVVADHRGSGHCGKAGTDYMHRNLGYWEMEDYTQCVQWLIENAQVNPEKVCLTGFSYGGYISAYALAYAPDVFTHAMAGGSVTDWLLYDAPYTERFMDSPQENPEGYKSSSIFTHLPNMKGKLLVYHGEIDENVHVQNTLQLVSRLQDLQKDFEMMIFPSGRHGWRGDKRTYENRMRMEFIYKYILEKPAPKMLYTNPALGAASSY